MPPTELRLTDVVRLLHIARKLTICGHIKLATSAKPGWRRQWHSWGTM